MSEQNTQNTPEPKQDIQPPYDGGPYDAHQLQRLTHHLQGKLEAGDPPVVDAPEPDQPEHVIHRPDFEPHAGAIREGTAALGGVRRLFSREGRAASRAAKGARSQQRADVLAHVSDRVARPRQTNNPKENIGWVGTSKYHVETGPAGPPPAGPEDPVDEDFSNLGQALFPKPPAGATAPNQLRPATRSELAADKRLDKRMRRGRKARMQGSWLEKSYGSLLDANAGHRLSRSEKKHMRYTARQAQKLDRKADRADSQFERVASTRNGAHYLWESGKAVAQEAAERTEPAREKTADAYFAVEDAAIALRKEIAERHRDSWDLTKEQAERIRRGAAYAGRLAVAKSMAAGSKVRSKIRRKKD